MDTEEQQRIQIFLETVGNTEDENETIRNLTIQDDDIMLYGYTKSGNHWVSYIICLLLNDGDETAYLDESRYCPYIDSHISSSHDPVEVFTNHPPPRQAYSHVQTKYIPKMMINGKGRLVYVLRNPKDICVSYFKHYNNDDFRHVLENALSSPDESKQLGCKVLIEKMINGIDGFVDHFIEGDILFGSWFDHVKGFLKLIASRPKKNTLLMIYENIHDDPPQAVRDIANFLGVECSEDKIAEIATKASFSRMKVDMYTDEDAAHPLAAIGKEMYFRNGKVGDWANHFTPEMAAKFDLAIQSQLADVDMPVNYIGAALTPHDELR